MGLGKSLCSINLLIVGNDQKVIRGHWRGNVFEKPMIYYIIKGCPRLKSLTFESLRGWKELPKFLNKYYTKVS